MISQFDSRCPACGEKIYEGDEIAKDDDLGWVHDECYEPPLRISKPVVKRRGGPSLADKLNAERPPNPGETLSERITEAAGFYLSLDEHEVRRVLDWLVFAESEGQAPAQGDEGIVKKLARCLPEGDNLREQCIGFLPASMRGTP